MNRPDLDFIQSSICYHFRNLKLLVQAFTRKSYSEEHPGVENNEVLEFYGDEILDMYVTKCMYKETASITETGFISSKNEGELTKLKASFVNKRVLASCIQNFGFDKFLFMGNSDIINKANESISVRCDLFEAIIGAVAADSNWNYEILDTVCKNMLTMTTINGYLELMVHEKTEKLGIELPVYSPAQFPGYDPIGFSGDYFVSRIYQPYKCTAKNPETGLYEYFVTIGNQRFTGYGDGIFQAFLDVNAKAMKWLCQIEIERTIQNVDFENPVSTLHELEQKEIIKLLGYSFDEYHDKDGNPIWRCSVFIEGLRAEGFTSEGPSKKEVKQMAARKALQELVDVKGKSDE